MSAQLENVLSRLRGVVRNGERFMALCPGHEDRNQSLSVKDGDKAVLIKCHAECSTESVLTKLGLTMGDLFFGAPASGDGNAGYPRQPKIVATYPYVDESGKLLYQVVRYEPKDFRQRKPDGKGGWTWKLGDVRRVLYGLPKVLAASDVLFVEGEKDADKGSALGFTATTSGSTGSWRPEFAETLRGKKVVIIADGDEPGRKHAQAVAASLFGKAESGTALANPERWVGWSVPQLLDRLAQVGVVARLEPAERE
jgi:putative DNA primase/helicase